VVWRGWDPKLERDVAIKEPVASPTISEAMTHELGERFVREGKTAARLNHPGIVTIFAADVFDGRPAIVMELLRGHTLSTLIDRRLLTFEASMSVLDQLLDALDYAQTMGVIHRDVKPDNIFVTDDGRVKLTDFGVAHVSRLDGQHDAIIAGTPGYMSPEQIVGDPVDSRSDIFGIGAIAYEMLAGFNPFGATDGIETTVMMYRTTNGPEPAFAPDSAVPHALQQVVLRALSRDAAQRFPSAGEMRVALRQAAAGVMSGGDGSLLDLVEEAGAPDVGVSFTGTTVNAMKERIPEKGSTGWVVGVAAGGSVAALGLLAMLTSSGGSSFGLLLLVGGGIGALAWYMWVQSKTHPAGEPPPEAQALMPERAGSDLVEICMRGPQEDRVLTVALPAVFGRSAEADVIVADDLASRRHARLERRAEGGLWISDVGSRNGTYLNGLPAGSGLQVGPNDVITLGSTEVWLTAMTDEVR